MIFCELKIQQAHTKNILQHESVLTEYLFYTQCDFETQILINFNMKRYVK